MMRETMKASSRTSTKAKATLGFFKNLAADDSGVSEDFTFLDDLLAMTVSMVVYIKQQYGGAENTWVLF
uniref:Uncharacterized protein n=1 Tax=Rhizophora mucronata TaxID=61149 RepID=A0A2P2M1V6_RHIMU